MKNLSLKLKDEVFEEVEKIVEKSHISRNAYINQSLFFYNQFNRRRMLKAKLKKESLAVQESSLEILREFEKLEEGLDL